MNEMGYEKTRARALALTCDHFGRDQICAQVNASFLPFDHPSQVSSQVQLAATCAYLRVRLTRPLLRTTIDCCGYTLSISLSTTIILYLLLIHIQASEFERPFCLRCLHEIANLCATMATTCFCYYYLSYTYVAQLVEHRVIIP